MKGDNIYPAIGFALREHLAGQRPSVISVSGDVEDQNASMPGSALITLSDFGKELFQKELQDTIGNSNINVSFADASLDEPDKKTPSRSPGKTGASKFLTFPEQLQKFGLKIMQEMQKELDIHMAQKDLLIAELQKTNQLLLEDIDNLKNGQIANFVAKQSNIAAAEDPILLLGLNQ